MLSKGFTKGEQFLLNDFSKEISTKSLIVFYFNGMLLSVVPVWIFQRMQWIDTYFYTVLVLIGPLTVYLMTVAYCNTKLKIKHKIAIKRAHVVTKRLTKFFEEKKINRKDRNDRLLLKVNEVDDFEATIGSLFYNNALFLGIVVFSNFILLRSFIPFLSLCVSTVGTAGLLALLSSEL